ncbi:Leucine-rich repeat-containing protein 69 [Tupaia chinensis]|uniref:Leucine-rich repeat-containing protein 69 n=1 Tax=Tupaia chinensis TaxID=246437 RepID=L9JB35_TUPCH|nr:Leucine-rich repeat-containing protein 69 [Tupaia chinensis]
MVERLLIKALQGGENTKIMTFTGKKIKKMPSTLEKLPALKTLDLQNNLIPEVCPEIRTLTQLTSLNLGNNLLEAVPEELKYLVSLRKLHLFGNRICRFASGVCGRLKSLVYMSINHNQLAIIPTELCSLLNLVELQLNYNQVIYIPEEIKFLKDLQKLLLARNNIKALPNTFCDLENLRILDIAGNLIQMFPPGNCKVSRNLQLVPVQILICSYRCFMQRSPNVFGVADA